METTQGKLSRQRKWQLKQQAKGCCVICAGKLSTRTLCATHAQNSRSYGRPRRSVKPGAPLPRKCRRCGQRDGHNLRTCTAKIPVILPARQPISEASASL